MKTEPSLEPQPVLYTQQQLAQRWQCSVAKIRKMQAAKKIPVMRIGKATRFRPADIEAFESAALLTA